MNKLVIAIFLSLLLASCTPSLETPVKIEGDQVNVNWIKVNSPPNEDGPCYVYFVTDSFGYNGYGYSGVWCK